MSELKRCPFCESIDVGLREFDDPERAWVQCRWCKMTGPTRTNSKLAISAWNVLSRNSDAEREKYLQSEKLRAEASSAIAEEEVAAAALDKRSIPEPPSEELQDV